MPGNVPKVGLLITCLVDLFRPRVAEAAVELLQGAGCQVSVPVQTCCGQVNHNGGDSEGAVRLARRMITAFGACDYVVAPSGSCAAMVRHHYPTLFPKDSADRSAAEDLARRTWELVSFLHDVMCLREVPARLSASVAYHDGCSGLRELGIREQPRALLRAVAGLSIADVAQPEECCGFGGLFCLKYPEVSARIADQKCADVLATGARYLIGGDLGCLLHLQGRLRRRGHTLAVAHIAEVLAGMVPGDEHAHD
jgi:L-lactate dehydrogenase complex protein LldE